MSFEKGIENVGIRVQKNAKILVVFFFIILLVGTPIGMTILGIVNPGFSGAMASCYGVNFKDFGTDWQGINTIHAVQNAETSLASHHSTGALGFITDSDNVKWDAGNGPESMTTVHDHTDFTLLASNLRETKLTTEVQSNIPLAAFNYQNSTPLALTNVATWDQGEVLQYWNVQPTSIVNSTLSNGTIISSVTYTANSQSLLLIPGNFYVDVYMPPSHYSAGTGSGWQEGTWNSVDLWYVMYWYEWLNALGPVLQNNEAAPTIPANALNRQDQFNLRGGFPIQGWIQGYQIPYPTSSGVVYDAVSATPASGSSTKNPIAASTMQNIMGQISLSPSLAGRPVTLYTQPSDQYQLPTYTLPGPVDSNATAQALLNSPDFQTILPTEYFKIGVQTMGTYVEGNILSGFTVYYPCVDYLLRFIFGVYGVHTYVWTVQTALQQGYNATQNYIQPPAQWETRTIVTVNTPGLFTGLLDWFSNPLNALQFYLILIVIVLLIVTVFNPGVWSNIFHRHQD